jgi:hypothetical protein
VPSGTRKHAAVTTTVWLTESIDRALRRNLRQRKVELIVDYLISRSMVHLYVVPDYDTETWNICHPDLHSCNIIINEDFKING